MAVQNDNTILNKGDLKAYHERIAPMLGGTFMVSTNNSDYYSTDEKMIGVWIDGKPLYQKTIECGAGPNNTSKTVAHGVANIDKIISATSINMDNTYYDPIPNTNMATYLSGIYATATSIIIVANWDTSSRTVYATIRYTKTTDAAGSATTTPGAYDINFPNTWPANKEIFFGNGMYGYRATGNVVTTGNTLPISGVKKFYGYGGSSDNGAGANIHTFPYTNPSALPTWGNCVWADHNNGIPHIYWGTGYTVNTTFDVWIKYSK